MRTINSSLAEIPTDREKIYLKAQRPKLNKRHWYRFADEGVEFSFDLESPLSHGDAFHSLDGKVYVIHQKKEKVFRVRYEDTNEFAYDTWQAGNMHIAIQFHDGALLMRTPWPASKS